LKILKTFELAYPIQQDMDWAIGQLTQFRLSHGVGMNDCLIASVCHRLQVPLSTHNLRHMTVLLGTTLAIKPY
jgi:predicted nucleic acid-binding protein